MWVLISPLRHANHSPSGQILHIAFCWRGNELLEQDCLLGRCLAGLASGLMVCLLAESTRYLTHRYLDIFIHSMHCAYNTTLNWPGICQWDPPSQAFYPSLRTSINCWNLSNEHLQVRPKKYHIQDSWLIGTSISFQFFCPKRYQKIGSFSILKRWKESWTEFPTSHIASPSRDNGSWPDSCGTIMVKYFTSSEKAPGKWWNHAPLKTRPLNFCCPSGNTCHFQCGLTWYLHNDSYAFLKHL